MIRIHFLIFLIKAVGIVLSPALVEDRVIAYAGVVVKQSERFLAGFFKQIFSIIGRSMRNAFFHTDGWEGSIDKEGIFSAVHHVLKDDHALLIAFVIEDIRLDLDVLAEHIEAERFHRADIETEALGRGGHINAVAEIALIEKSVEEIWLAVERDIIFAIDTVDAYGTERKIGAHGILAVGKGEMVKIRRFG